MDGRQSPVYPVSGGVQNATRVGSFPISTTTGENFQLPDIHASPNRAAAGSPVLGQMTAAKKTYSSVMIREDPGSLKGEQYLTMGKTFSTGTPVEYLKSSSSMMGRFSPELIKRPSPGDDAAGVPCSTVLGSKVGSNVPFGVQRSSDDFVTTSQEQLKRVDSRLAKSPEEWHAYHLKQAHKTRSVVPLHDRKELDKSNFETTTRSAYPVPLSPEPRSPSPVQDFAEKKVKSHFTIAYANPAAPNWQSATQSQFQPASRDALHESHNRLHAAKSLATAGSTISLAQNGNTDINDHYTSSYVHDQKGKSSNRHWGLRETQHANEMRSTYKSTNGDSHITFSTGPSPLEQWATTNARLFKEVSGQELSHSVKQRAVIEENHRQKPSSFSIGDDKPTRGVIQSEAQAQLRVHDLRAAKGSISPFQLNNIKQSHVTLGDSRSTPNAYISAAKSQFVAPSGHEQARPAVDKANRTHSSFSLHADAGMTSPSSVAHISHPAPDPQYLRQIMREKSQMTSPSVLKAKSHFLLGEDE